jgi:nitrate/nitrite transport system substrate-binding protein
LRYYVAEHGLDPDTQIRAVPPPEMVANLRADNIDGFLGPDPFNQRAVYDGVGFMHLLSKELWEGHPCCAFAASKEFVITKPNTYAALLKAIIDATAFAARQENRKEIAATTAASPPSSTFWQASMRRAKATSLLRAKRSLARASTAP